MAVAPGDEDERCPVPEYPVHVKVLMDSWRYYTLLAEDNRDQCTCNAPVWTTNGTDSVSYTLGQIFDT